MNLNEETREGNGFKTAKNLGLNIAKAMQNTAFQPKKNARMTQRSGPGTQGSLGAIPNHRYRRYFGIRPPGAPY